MAIVTLAIGLAAVGITFAVVHTVLLRPLLGRLFLRRGYPLTGRRGQTWRVLCGASEGIASEEE